MKQRILSTRTVSFFCMAWIFLALCGPAAAVDESAAQKSFESLADKWMTRLLDTSKANRETCTCDSNGLFVYTAYGPEKTVSIKKTDSKEAPFLGFLKYAEKSMEKKDSHDKASDITLNEIEVTEIFRFSNGRWVY